MYILNTFKRRYWNYCNYDCLLSLKNIESSNYLIKTFKNLYSLIVKIWKLVSLIKKKKQNPYLLIE